MHRMKTGKNNFKFTLKEISNMSEMGKALSSTVRLEILQKLIERSMTMSELSQELRVSLSSITMHIKCLHKVGLVEVVPKPGMHGAQKLCGIKADKVLFDFFDNENVESGKKMSKKMEIPIGLYSRAEIQEPCGIVNEEEYVDIEDTQFCFYNPSHVEAQLIWFTTGYLEYNISNKYIQNEDVHSINISFEVCAEAPGYNNEWPSDINITINDKSITTFRVQGDYGGSRGVNNPSWWSDSNTQFGELKKISITEKGTYLNGNLVSIHTISSLNIKGKSYFTFRIGVFENSECTGGINLFGKKFGNYAQDICVEVCYE